MVARSLSRRGIRMWFLVVKYFSKCASEYGSPLRYHLWVSDNLSVCARASGHVSSVGFPRTITCLSSNQSLIRWSRASSFNVHMASSDAGGP